MRRRLLWIALATLLILCAISALSLSPWPRWWTVAPRALLEVAGPPEAIVTVAGR